jgi:hypothetical protein
MIYNFSEKEVEKKIQALAALFCTKQNYEKELQSFVENADGDYIIQIWDKKEERYILFNDYLGRLSLYYYFNENNTLISREIKFILEFIPEIKFDKTGIVENLMLGYTLGEKTIFKDIKRLYPCEYIICEFKKDGINYKKGKTAEFNFNLKSRFYSKNKSLNQLKKQYLQATKDRINKLNEKGYKIISDLSGGYDSRALIGGLCKYDKDIDYYTYEYIQDESIVAKKLFEELGSPGNHIKTSFKNVVDLENISSLVFKTDGLVNYYTTGICYNDANHLKEITANKIGHFSGFGGEFIRHPERKYFLSVKKGFLKGIYSHVLPQEACLIINYNVINFIKEENEYFKQYSKKRKDNQLKHFYYEYYRNLVGLAGEERGRIFQWLLQPLWSKNFVKTIFNQIPLKWTGFSFFIRFMHLIDDRLLNVPIYKSKIDLRSSSSIKDFEKNYKNQYNFKNRLHFFLLEKTPILIKFYKQIKGKNKKLDHIENQELLTLFYNYYNRLDKCNSLFDIEAVEKYIHKTGGQYNRLTTLVIYLQELEKMYKSKISATK